jgi:carboxymethylenebutenolidase
MCFNLDAVPPPLPTVGLPVGFTSGAGQGIARQDRLTLTSADGTPFSAYLALPTAGNGAGIVILPDVRGLFTFYEDLATRFANAGVAAIAVDYFGRTAGLAPRGADFEFMPHVMQTTPAQITQDVAAAVEQIRTVGQAQAVFTVGFCFGGFHSLLQAASQHGLSGVIAFYGGPTTNRFGSKAPIDRIDEITCPILGLYGGADQGIPVAEVQRFDAALTAAGKEHEIVIYPDTPHSFFDRTYEQYQSESADAWQRMLGFIAAHTPKGTI